MAVATTQHSNSSYAGAQQQPEKLYHLFSIGLGSKPSMLHHSKQVRAAQLLMLVPASIPAKISRHT
jgi:hypothetical protein